MSSIGRFFLISGVLPVVWLSVVGCAPQTGQPLAQVGSQTITTDEFELALDNLPENYKILAESYKGKRKILGNLVKKDLLILEAEKRGYQRDPEVITKIKAMQKSAGQRLQQQLADLKRRRNSLDQQMYENVMLNTLNQRLKEEGASDPAVTESDVADYYADYVRKLKILNPAAPTPSLDNVRPQIQSILREEALIQKLEKEHSVEVQEERFQRLYGDKSENPVIGDQPAQ